MDKASEAKKLIADKGEFLGAVRLPNNAFSEAGVVTDIIAFKRDYSGKSTNNLPLEIEEYEGAYISKYFLDNPQNVLGELRVIKNRFGDLVVDVKDNGSYNPATLDLNKYFKTAENALNSGEMSKAEAEAIKASLDKQKIIKSDLYDRDYTLQQVKELEKWSNPELYVNDYERILPKLQNLENALKTIREAEADLNVSEGTLKLYRQRLKEAYKDLLKDLNTKTLKEASKSGKHSTRGFKVYKEIDNNAFEILSLETKEGLSDIFEKRVYTPYIAPTSATDLEDAVNITLNEWGYLNLNRIADLLKSDPQTIDKLLLEKEFLFIDGRGIKIERAEFLSGDVKTKLAEFRDERGILKFTNKDDEHSLLQQKAYEALKKVIPANKNILDIDLSLGDVFVTEDIYKQWAKETLGVDIDLKYFKESGWIIGNTREILEKNKDFLIAVDKDILEIQNLKSPIPESENALEYLQDFFNNKATTISYTRETHYGDNLNLIAPIATRRLMQIKKQLQKSFSNFVLDNVKVAEAIEKNYNDLYTRIVPRTYDGSSLKMIGMNQNITLNPHQKNAIFRSIIEKAVGLFHEVGTGKTYTMIGSVMELKRLRLIKKGLIVVPSHLAAQLAAEARNLYPNAKILSIANISTKEKEKYLSYVKNNELDIVVASYETLTKIGNSKEALELYKEQEIKALAEKVSYLKEKLKQNPNKSTEKELIQAISSVNRQIEKHEQFMLVAEQSKSNVSNLSSLGFDFIAFDEAHYIKSLPIITTKRNVLGIPNGFSQRAMDAFLKIQQLLKEGGRVMFSTGTPITNYVADIYNILRYLKSDLLRENNIYDYDFFSAAFTEDIVTMEKKLNGEYKETIRQSSFKNLDGLKRLVSTFADYVTKDDMKKYALEKGLKSPEPEANRQQHVIKKTQAHKEIDKIVADRYNKMKNKRFKEKGDDNALSILSYAAMADLDPRLVDKNFIIDKNETTKIKESANAIFENYKKWNHEQGTQLVFCDRGIPKKKGRTEAKIKKDIQRVENLLIVADEKGNFEKAELYQSQIDILKEELANLEVNFDMY
ncbi:MAG: SNF2-related protein, partial [Helicobacter sp.]|nr:SNF2-related protein [Helicobacter sp.]